MAVSLGVRLTGLFVAGALVITMAAACGGGGGKAGPSDAGGSGGTSVSGGVSSGGQDGGGTVGGMPTWQPSDGDGGSGGSVGSGGSGTPGGSAVSGGSGGRVRGSVVGPGWLPFGPHSPNTDTSSDPESVYDDLGEQPEACRETAAKIPAEPTDADWQVIRGLAEACQAVQGQGGSWATAAADYAAVHDRLTGCKGRAAYAVLGKVLQFHRQHPSATVKLKASTSGGADACDLQIVSVDVGGDGEARPGDTITIKVGGIYFSKSELLEGTSGSVTVAGVPPILAEDPKYDAEPPDQLTFKVFVPDAQSGTYPQSADVTVQYGEQATLKDAFTLVAADPGSAAGLSPDDSPATSQEESAATGTASSW